MSMCIKGKRKTFKSLNENIGFGIHSNKTINDVLVCDIHYLKWMHNSTNNKLGKCLIKEIEKLDKKYVGMFK